MAEPTASLFRRDDAAGFRLCLIEENVWAYFANVEPTAMGGDDWNDAPHDCNASQPYPRAGQEVVRVAYDGPYEMLGTQSTATTEDRLYGYSVDEINAKLIPWLADRGYGETYPKYKDLIWAGTTLAEFVTRMQRAGGNVYEQVPNVR